MDLTYEELKVDTAKLMMITPRCLDLTYEELKQVLEDDILDMDNVFVSYL